MSEYPDRQWTCLNPECGEQSQLWPDEQAPSNCEFCGSEVEVTEL